MAKKPSKKRASKYDKKLTIGGTFAEVIKVSVQPDNKAEMPKEKQVKNKKTSN